MSSQAQLYKYLKEESPELYEQVKKLVKAGRWEVEGAMWVEADRKLEESIRAEENGDMEAAKSAMLDAEIADSASRMAVVNMEQPKAKGVTSTKDWEIDSIDLSKVPTEVMGMVIRPVDTAAVMKLIRASKGQIQIEGIKYHETLKTSFRRS